MNNSKFFTSSKIIKQRKLLLYNVVAYTFLILTSIVCLLPIYFLISYATTSNYDFFKNGAFFPNSGFLENYNFLSKLLPFTIAIKNSLFVSLSATLLSAYFGGLTAFAFAKYNFKGKKFLFAVIILSLIYPQQISLIGFFKVCSILNVNKSLLPLIIPSIANAGFVFYVRYYIESAVSDCVMDSARIAGFSEFRIFNSIILPMITPAIFTMSLLTFSSNWNSFLIPVMIIDNNEALVTLPVLVLWSNGVYAGDNSFVFITALVTLIPILVLYLFFSKFFIKGIVMGSLK